MRPRATVVVPAHNRPAAISETVAALLPAARAAQAEVVVVDDGSTPPLTLDPKADLRIIRTEGIERSRARNAGALAARGERLLFVDDDITVRPDFVVHHLAGMAEFGDVITVGRISLPAEWAGSPFGRFRRLIEDPGERLRGFVGEKNFCTAANMSIDRSRFLALGGFDPAILSAEDQDLALRFCETGGRIVYLPEADGIHRDSVADMATYGRRHEWGARAMAPYLRRYPDRPENRLRADLAAPWIRLPPTRWPGRLARLSLACPPAVLSIEAGVSALESLPVSDGARFHFYRLLLGLRLLRGFRQGLATVRAAPPLPASIASPDRAE